MMIFRVVLLGAILINSSGCFLAPAIESFSKMGVTRGDRQALLSRDIKKFTDALYWGKPDEALGYAIEESRPTLVTELRRNKGQERIIESRVEAVDFSEDAYDAKVEVVVRYFKVPYYIVNERTEEQVWKFVLSDGWKILSRDVIEPKKNI